MGSVRVEAYGSWESPITSDLIVSEAIRLGEVVLEGSDVYWIEGRPTEGGRNVIVRCTADGQALDSIGAPFNVRTRVHEYGGAPFAVLHSVLYFSNFADQRVYRLAPDSRPQPLTPDVDLRYADGIIDRRRGRMICVREDHTTEGEAVNTLVSLDLEREGPGTVLVSGSDFYSTPRLHPDGTRLAWLSWNHPNMPWDGTELWTAEVRGDGRIGVPARVAGGSEESVFQPAWSPDGTLHFVSDRTGWWNLYRWRDGRVQAILPMEAEFGLPQWVFGMSTYGFDTGDRIICSYIQDGRSHLASLEIEADRLTSFELPYTTIGGLQVVPGRAVFRGSSTTETTRIVSLDLSSGETQVLKRSSDLTIEAGYLSVPETIEFATEGGHTAHALFYLPKNLGFTAPSGEQPPLLVKSHGGPTGAAVGALDWGIQYWTSRGFAVVDVNYGGSAGYGRAYRQRLNGQWGIVDVDDCISAALWLAERGLVDRQRLAIRGRSAGGYTTLAALAFRDVFRAGASHFGVSDLEELARDTHKFESRYLDRLVGPYPQSRDLYRQRSPIHFTDRLSCPMIFFQGLEDRVVPPRQAETMVEAVRAKGLPVAYLPFEGEQHGFRRAENIKRTLDAELYFYSRIFDFELAEPVEPVPIDNLG